MISALTFGVSFYYFYQRQLENLTEQGEFAHTMIPKYQYMALCVELEMWRVGLYLCLFERVDSFKRKST